MNRQLFIVSLLLLPACLFSQPIIFYGKYDCTEIYCESYEFILPDINENMSSLPIDKEYYQEWEERIWFNWIHDYDNFKIKILPPSSLNIVIEISENGTGSFDGDPFTWEREPVPVDDDL